MMRKVCHKRSLVLPVMRPLIAFDKQDIVDISLKIGTYETSVLPYEDYCTIFCRKASGHAELKEDQKFEKKLDEKIVELMKTALETKVIAASKKVQKNCRK